MITAEDMVGADGTRAYALPHEELIDVLERYGRLNPRDSYEDTTPAIMRMIKATRSSPADQSSSSPENRRRFLFRALSRSRGSMCGPVVSLGIVAQDTVNKNRIVGVSL